MHIDLTSNGGLECKLMTAFCLTVSDAAHTAIAIVCTLGRLPQQSCSQSAVQSQRRLAKHLEGDLHCILNVAEQAASDHLSYSCCIMIFHFISTCILHCTELRTQPRPAVTAGAENCDRSIPGIPSC